MLINNSWFLHLFNVLLLLFFCTLAFCVLLKCKSYGVCGAWVPCVNSFYCFNFINAFLFSLMSNYII